MAVSTNGDALIISYEGQSIRTLALNSAVAAAQLGEVVAVWLHGLLAEIEAAEDASDLFSLYGTLAKSTESLVSISFAPGFAATFAVVRENGSMDDHGLPIWPMVRRLKLVRVETDGSDG